jgi:DNA-binding GntR family transcriptional regulator
MSDRARQPVPHRVPSAARPDVPLRQAAYACIEDLLNAGALRPGQIITQRQLVSMTGSTLASVREAVPKFEAEGLLVTVPQRGLMVPSLDVRFVREAYQLRLVLELSALTEVVDRFGRPEIARWIDWHQMARRRLLAEGIVEAGFAEEIQRRDWDLHQSFVGALGNTLISNVYRVTAIKIRMVVQARIRVSDANALRVLDEHLAVLEALHDNDIEAARRSLETHLGNSLKLALGENV